MVKITNTHTQAQACTYTYTHKHIQNNHMQGLLQYYTVLWLTMECCGYNNILCTLQRLPEVFVVENVHKYRESFKCNVQVPAFYSALNHVTLNSATSHTDALQRQFTAKIV